MRDVDAELRSWWEKRRAEIEGRLAEFKRVPSEGEGRLFEELAFCLLTPQSSAKAADRAMRHLIHTGLLEEGSEEQIARVIGGCGIRFGENKARYVVEAREKLLSSRPTMSFSDLLVDDPAEARERIVRNIRGLGYKEASHFLRNIGYRGLAILDRHILRTLREAKVIETVPSALSKGLYLDLERKFLAYSRRLGIPPDALDLVIWSSRTGHLLK